MILRTQSWLATSSRLHGGLTGALALATTVSRDRRLRLWFAGFLALAALALGVMRIVGAPIPEPAGERLDRVAFTGVRIVDAAHEGVSDPRTILVSAGRVQSIRPDDSGTVPKDFATIPLPGRFVVPGFWDMHAHFGRLQLHYAGPMMLMHGVFYARNMSGDCVGWMCFFERDVEANRALTHAALAGDVMAPAFLGGVGSYIIRGSRNASSHDYPTEPFFLVPSTYEEGLALAQYAASRGVDFLKPYNSLHADAFRGLLDGASQEGLYVGGHVPRMLTLDDALALGLRTVEHARMLPLACTAMSSELAADYEAWVEDPAAARDEPKASRMLDELLENPDDARCERVLNDWAERDAYYVPTHVTRLADTHAVNRPFVDDPRARYVPQLFLRWGWESQASDYESDAREHPERVALLRAFYDRGVELTGQAHRAGVKLMIGSDNGDVLIYPGASFHEEMRIFEDAGIPPAAILAAATSVPASFVGMSDTYGSIAEGTRADFVFLDQNPLIDIANADTIAALYVGGRFYDGEARRAVMEEVAGKSRGLRHHLTVGWFLITQALPGAVARGIARLRAERTDGPQ